MRISNLRCIIAVCYDRSAPLPALVCIFGGYGRASILHSLFCIRHFRHPPAFRTSLRRGTQVVAAVRSCGSCIVRSLAGIDGPLQVRPIAGVVLDDVREVGGSIYASQYVHAPFKRLGERHVT
jgi:hypothetical protein